MASPQSSPKERNKVELKSTTLYTKYSKQKAPNSGLFYFTFNALNVVGS